MSELHKFLFQDLPVRGAIVRLTDAWVEILQRHSAGAGQPYPQPVQRLLGELAAAATLMRSSIKFNGSLTLQIVGDGPVKLVVAQVQPDLGLRATATVTGEVAADAGLSAMVNAGHTGRCAITLDPQSAVPGQNPYQGVVPLARSARGRTRPAQRGDRAVHAAKRTARNHAGARGRRQGRRRTD